MSHDDDDLELLLDGVPLPPDAAPRPANPLAESVRRTVERATRDGVRPRAAREISDLLENAGTLLTAGRRLEPDAAAGTAAADAARASDANDDLGDAVPWAKSEWAAKPERTSSGRRGPAAPQVSVAEARAALEAVLRKVSLYGEMISEQVQESLAEEDAAEAVDPSVLAAEDPRRLDPSLAPPPGLSLLPHQRSGMRWMQALYENGVNGILADEMGLGKTVQIAAFFGRLASLGVLGPHMVVVPLSTIPNWQRELQRWCPDIPLRTYHGDAKARADVRQWLRKRSRVPDGPADVAPHRLLRHIGGIVLTTYEMMVQDCGKLCREDAYRWQVLVVDEAHRLKNFECQLIKKLRPLPCEARVVLTGTPLQNNVAELWSILNFIVPEVFQDVAQFERWFESDAPDDAAAALVDLEAASDEALGTEAEAGGAAGGAEAMPRHGSVHLSTATHHDGGHRRADPEEQAALAEADADAEAATASPTDASSPTAATAASVDAEVERHAVQVPLALLDDEEAPVAVKAAPIAGSVAEPTAAGDGVSCTLTAGQRAAQARAIVRMHRVLRPFMLRRLKDTVEALALPPRAHVVLRCPMTRPQAEAYRKLSGRSKDGRARAHITTLRLVACHPHLVPQYDPFHAAVKANAGATVWAHNPQRTAAYRRQLAADSSKLALLLRMLARLREGGHHTLIFSQFTSVLDVLEEALQHRGAIDAGEDTPDVTTALPADPAAFPGHYVRLDGATSLEARRRAMAAFERGAEGGLTAHVFLLSTRAGGVGLNLTAADTVVLFDCDFNPHNDVQAVARCHRIGQARPVAVYRLVVPRTIEESMLAIAVRKLRLERAVIRCGAFDGQKPAAADGADQAAAGAALDAAGLAEEARAIAAVELALQSNDHFSDVAFGGDEAIDDATLGRLLDRDGIIASTAQAQGELFEVLEV